MSRLMSVAYTEQAVRERRKTVTRRLGWRFLKSGDRLTLCRKVMGRKPGEPLVRIAEVEIVDVRRESILAVTDAEVTLEGAEPWDYRYDEWDSATGMPTAESWVTWYCETFDLYPYYDDVTRIEWRYLDEVGAALGAERGAA